MAQRFVSAATYSCNPARSHPLDYEWLLANVSFNFRFAFVAYISIPFAQFVAVPHIICIH